MTLTKTPFRNNSLVASGGVATSHHHHNRKHSEPENGSTLLRTRQNH